MKRRGCLIGAGLGALVLVLAVLALPPTALGAWLRVLPLGWWHFLRRNAAQVAVNGDVAGMGVVCSALLLLLGHRLARGLAAAAQRRHGATATAPRWRWKWTLVVYAALWLLFAVVFGAAGIYRQAAWLNKYGEPWYEDRHGNLPALAFADWAVKTILVNESDLNKVRTQCLHAASPLRPSALLCEDFNVLLYGDRNGRVAAYVIIPRDPLPKEARFWKVSVAGSEPSLTRGELSELPQALAELEAKYPNPRE